MGVELLLDAFQESRGIDSATPDEARREAVEFGRHDNEASAEGDGGRTELANQNAGQVGVGELGKSRDDDAAGGVGLDSASSVEIQ